MREFGGFSLRCYLDLYDHRLFYTLAVKPYNGVEVRHSGCWREQQHGREQGEREEAEGRDGERRSHWALEGETVIEGFRG